MRTTVLGMFLSAAFFYGCALYHNHKTAEHGYFMSEEIAAIISQYGDPRPSGNCITIQSNIGDIVECAVPGTDSASTSDDYLSISFPDDEGNKVYIDYGLDDTLDYVVTIKETATTTAFTDFNKRSQKVLGQNYISIRIATKQVFAAYGWE